MGDLVGRGGSLNKETYVQSEVSFGCQWLLEVAVESVDGCSWGTVQHSIQSLHNITLVLHTIAGLHCKGFKVNFSSSCWCLCSYVVAFVELHFIFTCQRKQFPLLYTYCVGYDVRCTCGYSSI